MKPRFRIELLLLALVCFGPVLGAYFLYYYGEPRELPIVPNEERSLISPALPLPALPGTDPAGNPVESVWSGPKWSLVYARASACDDRCRRDLIRLAQVHVALNRDQGRVQRVYLGPPAEGLPAEALALAVARLDGPEAEPLLALLESVDAAPQGRGRVYVVDPHGNLVLSYPPDAEQKGLHDDLKRLLDVSRIG